MTTIYRRTAAIAIVGLVLSALPASAQQGRRQDGDGRRDNGGRAEGRRDNGGRAEGRRENGGRAEGRREGGSRVEGRRDEGRRVEGRRDDGDRRAQPRFEGRSRSDDRRNDGPRIRVDVRPRVVVVPDRRAYGGRSYGNRSYVRRSYVAPFGYRPYGYRPGWSASLYFGRPRGAHIYGQPAYGYYAIDGGYSYGALRIVDAPRDARVFVDGYYAGVVDDYDGVFQRLNLEDGAHHIEIEVEPGAPPLEFDVRIVPGETVTYHAQF